MVNDSALSFFGGSPEELGLYETFEEKVMELGDGIKIKTGKTQITFSNKHVFACVSMLRLRKKKDLPEHFIVITFGLGRHEPSPRIDVATEPYPNRWTHHVLVQDESEIDDELMEWVKEAFSFSDAK